MEIMTLKTEDDMSIAMSKVSLSKTARAQRIHVSPLKAVLLSVAMIQEKTSVFAFGCSIFDPI